MKHVPVLFIFFLGSLSISFAQDTTFCEPDTMFVNSGAIVSPSPFINDTLGDGLPDACLNTPYDLTIFVNPPTVFTVSGVSIPVNSFTIDSLVNLPKGMEYSCSAEDCNFLAGQVSCIYLSGTPTAENTDTLYQLKIHLTVNTILPIPVAFPDPSLAPGKYDLILHPEGAPACETVATRDYQISDDLLRIFPNPVSNILNIQLENQREIIEDVRIWDQSGSLLKQVRLGATGRSSMSIEDLPPGFYLTTIRSQSGNYRGKFVKN